MKALEEAESCQNYSPFYFGVSQMNPLVHTVLRKESGVHVLTGKSTTGNRKNYHCIRKTAIEGELNSSV